jgi:EAL domain-containing protein (putative c-di-GMP-specific phosphodiesterase class I)
MLGSTWKQRVILLLVIPIVMWLLRGPSGWSRTRTVTLAYPLWRAIRSHELVLFFQPKAEAVGGRVGWVEALVRWRHPRRGLLHPAEFLPAIQDGLLERAFNRFVLRAAVRQAAAWESEGRPLRIAINVSPGYVIGGDLVPYLRHLLAESEVDERLLLIEVPEFALRDGEVERFNTAIRDVRALGISVSIDDFGMGHSSLARLVELPIDVLKIDRMFIAGMAKDHKSDRVVHTAIDLGHALGLVVVAEGVETDQQWIQLTAWGCDLVQGYKIKRPVPASELSSWLDETGHEVPRFARGPRVRQR